MFSSTVVEKPTLCYTLIKSVKFAAPTVWDAHRFFNPCVHGLLVGHMCLHLNNINHRKEIKVKFFFKFPWRVWCRNVNSVCHQRLCKLTLQRHVDRILPRLWRWGLIQTKILKYKITKYTKSIKSQELLRTKYLFKNIYLMMPNTLSSSEYTYTAVDLYTVLYCILRSWVSTKAVKTLSGKQQLKA